MTQEEKQLLLKDLSARLPYWVFVNVTDPEDNKTNYNCLLSTDILKEVSRKTSNLNYKPYLRPMESMTDKEGEELNEHITIYDDVDWMLAHYFDFRGLISKGLALEAPEGMYKIKTAKIMEE